MENDLARPKAALEWTLTQIKLLRGRIDSWREGSPYVAIIDLDGETGKKALRQIIREPLPLLVKAEIGVIINSIRTSLDLLVTALAKRNGVSDLARGMNDQSR